MLKCLWGFFAALLPFSVSVGALAISVTPSVIELAQGSEGAVVFRFAASPGAAAALELQVVERRPEGGGEVLVPVEGVWDVLPPQLYIEAGEEADVRLTWQGDLPGGRSRSFYLVAAELPIVLGEPPEENEIRFIARFYIPLHVAAPDSPAPSLQLRSLPGGDIEIANQGARYVRLSGLGLRVLDSAGGALAVVEGVELARLAQVDAVLPQGSVTVPAEALALPGAPAGFDLYLLPGP